MRPFLSAASERLLLQIADVQDRKLQSDRVSFSAAAESGLIDAALVEIVRGAPWRRAAGGRVWGPYRLTAKGRRLVEGLRSIEAAPPPAPRPAISFRERVKRFLGRKLTERACPFCGHKPVGWQPMGAITVPLAFMGEEPSPVRLLAVMCAGCAGIALFPPGQQLDLTPDPPTEALLRWKARRQREQVYERLAEREGEGGG